MFESIPSRSACLEKRKDKAFWKFPDHRPLNCISLPISRGNFVTFNQSDSTTSRSIDVLNSSRSEHDTVNWRADSGRVGSASCPGWPRHGRFNARKHRRGIRNVTMTRLLLLLLLLFLPLYSFGRRIIGRWNNRDATTFANHPSKLFFSILLGETSIRKVNELSQSSLPPPSYRLIDPGGRFFRRRYPVGEGNSF